MNETTGCVLMVAVVIFGMATCTVTESWENMRKAEIQSRERVEILRATGKLPEMEVKP